MNAPVMKERSFQISPLSPTFGLMLEAAPGDPLPDPAEVMRLGLEAGALLLRGFALDLDSFVDFTNRCCPGFSTYVGGGIRFRALNRDSLGAGGTVMSTTGSSQSFPIPVHGEMYYQKQRPDVLWFYCQQAPSEHGQTIVADGRLVFERLSPATREILCSKRLRYIRELSAEDWATSFMTEDPGELKRICDANDLALEVRPDRSVRIEYLAPAVFPAGEGRHALINSAILLWEFERAVVSGAAAAVLGAGAPEKPPMVVRFEDGQEIPEAIMREIEQASDSATVRLNWRNGDVAMVDNRFVMHGRRKTVGAERKILVRLGNLT
jgi:alpha-ketoglutarate-dependent taurine dioxygenase